MKLYAKAFGQSALNLAQFAPGVDDATAALATAIKAATELGTYTTHAAGNHVIEIPSGTFKIDPGTLSQAGLAPHFGLTFRGAGMDATCLELIDDGVTDGWFYDNGNAAISDRNAFHGIRFRGQDTSRANGFKITDTTGKEKRFQFHSCKFDNLNVLQRCDGTANADEFTFVACEMTNIVNLLRYNNAQAMLHHFIGCRGGFTGDIVVVESGGGGEFLWLGGSIIHNPDGESWWVRAENDPATSSQTGQFLFTKFRAELRSGDSKLVNWQNGTSTAAGRDVRIVFDDVNLAAAIQGTGSLRSNSVIVGGGKFVHFKGCMLPEAASGSNDTFEFRVDHNDSWSTVSNPGTILFENCTGHPNLRDDCAIENRYGRIISRGAVGNSLASSHEDRRALDFDLGWEHVAGHGTTATKKVAPMLRANWPVGSGSNEGTVILPAGAVPVRAVFFQPAFGISSVAKQIKISSDDKSIDYAVSASDRDDAEHSATADINIGPLSSDTKFRLHATAGTLVREGGYAFIEYI